MTEMPHLIGGALCLDFVNTVDPRHARERREYLDSYPALVAWGSHAGAIDAEQGDRLREALYSLFSQAGSRPRPERDDLGVLQAEVTGALAHFRVAWSPAGFGWEWDQASPGLDRVLWPVAWSAAELLVQGPLERIRECPGQDTCGWLFLDLSKNASRRWCDMRVCGNRAKARRHYERTLSPANRSRSRAASAV